jgi:predicted RNase H-like HicB family nuclease
VPNLPGAVAAGDSPQEVEQLLAEALAEHMTVSLGDRFGR